MIVEYIRYTIPADQADGFQAAYGRAQEALRASPHCLGFELSRCTEEPQSYVLRIAWDSLAGHLEGFRKSAQFASFLVEVRPYIDRIAEMRHYEVTNVCWSRPEVSSG